MESIKESAASSRLPTNGGSGDSIFVTTRWTMVLAAADRSDPQAERAMEEICSIYWFPIYAYIRRRNHSPEDAEDLTQEFFRCLCEKHWIADADREKGKLRAFLITALKRFLAKEWRRACAQKRGGGQPHISIDTDIAERRYEAAGTPNLEAEALFDRQWALSLLELTMKRLEQEYAEAGKTTLFIQLKNGLIMEHQSIDYTAMASALDMNEGAVRVAVHRLRKRFRELYRAEVAQTLPLGVSLDDELRDLAASLVRH
ncbi:MAG: sigma-70 family RNA polymerase sigma factor [Lentisphaerae bacterium]|nr:sigma-70 family RNA polymerase sigma factor [Lentisphaerota bacterium]